VFNQDRLIRSYQGIANLGFFETPLPFPDTRPANEAGDIDIIFRVKEKRTGNVSFGASGAGHGPRRLHRLEQPNLFGKCKRGNINWQFGQFINDFNAAYTDPGIRGSLVSGTVSGYRSQARFRIADLGRRHAHRRFPAGRRPVPGVALHARVHVLRPGVRAVRVGRAAGP
jgi:outer membrane protein insertion porin family